MTKRILGLVCALAGLAGAQTPVIDRGLSYYHYSLGHLYSELAAGYANRAEYVNQAIDNYREALKADPTAKFLADELADLYVQSGRLNEGARDAEAAVRKNPNDTNARRILGRIYSRLVGDTRTGTVNEGMVKRAIEQYAKIAELEPKNLDAWLTLGRLHKINQDSVEAQKSFNKALEIDPENQDALTGLALVYSDLGDHQRAIDVLKKVSAKTPDSRTLVSLAASYEQMHDYASAADAYRKAVELSPENDELVRALGQSLFYAGKLDEALEVFNELAMADPADVELQLRLAQIYREKRDTKNARVALDKARAAQPANPEILLTESLVLRDEGREADAADALSRVLQATEKSTYTQSEKLNRGRLLDQLGELHRSIDQFPEALKVYRELNELDPGPRSTALVIDTLRVDRQFPEAIKAADAAAKQYPNDRLITLMRSSVLADMGRSAEAVSEVRKLLDGKNDRATYLTLASTYVKGKNFAETAKAIDAAEKLSTTDEEKESIYLMRGEMYEKMKRVPEAEAEFRKALAISPDSAGALNYIGYMLADRNIRLDEAVTLISKALELEPNSGAYLDSLGWAYYRLARFGEAEQTLVKAAARTKRDPTVHDHLGDTYIAEGKIKEALESWETSLKLWRESAPADIDQDEIAKIQKKIESGRARQTADRR